MSEGKSIFPWSGADERSIVEEMIRNGDSWHWDECRRYVQQYVRTKKVVSVDNQEEVIQEVMCRVARGLPDFRFGCAFKTWLITIIERCTIDMYRKSQHEGKFHIPLDNSPGENEGEAIALNEARSPEHAAIVIDELRAALAALLEYADTYSNPARARIIINMVIIEGHTYEEAAIAVGCKAPVVGYVVRQAQSYVRKKMRHNP
jgi:RNA polymerase sigma factor (sigma-70 family)